MSHSSQLDSLFDQLAHPRHNGRQSPRELPDARIVGEISDALLDLLFPAHRIGRGNVASAVRSTGRQAFALFGEQARIAQTHQSPDAEPSLSPDDITMQLLQDMTSIRERVWRDMHAAWQGDPAATGPDEVILSYPTFPAVATYRIANALHRLGLPLIPRMMTEHAHRLTGIDIHPGATIGDAFFIDHGTGVVIGETADIGDRARLYQGVTLGALNFPKDDQGNLIRGAKRHPTLKDDVTVYANATILGGGTEIGDRSVIGGNVWLTHSVPADSVVTINEPGQTVRSRRK